MSIDAADLVRMRSRPQAQDFYMAVLHPITVWTGQVVGDPDRGAISIPFDNASELTAPEEHFTLWVGSPGITGEGECDVGVLRFRSKTANTMKVGSNDIIWADNQNLTIKREVRPWAVLPNLENTKEDSDKDYNNENTVLHPLGRVGPPACAILEDGTTTVSFWSDSVSISEDGLKSHAWVFDGGSPGSSAIAGTAGTPIAVTYTTPGQKWVKYTVTDNNNKTHVRYSMVYVFNTTTDIAISGFEVGSLVGDLESGVWRASITVTQDCDETEFPEMAQVVIFNKAYWNAAQRDVGYGWKHRENISFVGYIVKDSVRKNAETGNTTFEVTSTVSIMKNLTCWGASLKKSGTAGWHVIPNMTLNLAAFHVFTEHTTLDHIADIYLNLDTITMAYIDFQEGSPYDHIKTQIGEAGRAILANNKFGQIYLEPDVQVTKAAYRLAIDTMFDLVHGDWREEITLGEERDIENTCQVDFIGFTYSGTDPIPFGSLAPGRQWSTGGVQKVTGVRVMDQDEANVYSGLFAGKFNNEFDNVVIPMAGFWPVFDIAPQRFVRITLVATDTNRELIWTLEEHIPAQVALNINNESGYTLTDITFKQLAYGPPGIDNEIPSEPTSPDPDPPPEPLPPDPAIPDLPPQAALAFNRLHIGYTPNILLHHVSSTATGGSGTTLHDTSVDFEVLGVVVDDLVENMTTYTRTRVANVVSTTQITLDADISITADCDYHICGAQWTKVGDYTADFNGEEVLQVEEIQTGTGAIGAWVLTTGGVYWASNILTTSPSWSCKLTLAELNTQLGTCPFGGTPGSFRGLRTYVSNPSFIIVHFEANCSGYTSTYGCVYSNSLGSSGTWIYSTFPTHEGRCPYRAIEIDTASGTIYVIRNLTTGNTGRLYVSVDGGATFALKAGEVTQWVHSGLSSTRADIYRPYGGSGLYVELRESNVSPGKSNDVGASWTVLTAAGYSDPNGGVNTSSHGITGHYADDNDILAIWRADDDSHIVLMRSLNGGSTWVEIADAVTLFKSVIDEARAVAPTTWPADNEIIAWVCRWDTESVSYLGDSMIRYTDDGGTKWFDMMGNWYLNTDFHCIGDAGGDWAGSHGTSGIAGGVGVILLPRAGDNA